MICDTDISWIGSVAACCTWNSAITTIKTTNQGTLDLRKIESLAVRNYYIGRFLSSKPCFGYCFWKLELVRSCWKLQQVGSSNDFVIWSNSCISIVQTIFSIDSARSFLFLSFSACSPGRWVWCQRKLFAIIFDQGFDKLLFQNHEGLVHFFDLWYSWLWLWKFEVTFE